MKKEDDTIVSLAVKASADMIIDTYGLPTLSNVSTHLIASLLAAGAYSIRRIFSISPDGELQAEQFRKILEQIKVEVEVLQSGEHTTSVMQLAVPPPPPSFTLPKEQEGKFSMSRYGRRRTKIFFAQSRTAKCRDHRKLVSPITVENKEGTTIYNIQNLNIYLTADVVQQLNINPQQVINQLHEQIKEEIDKITKEEIDNGTHAIVVNK